MPQATRLADGRLLYELKNRWRNGTTHIGFEPLELMERLAAFVAAAAIQSRAISRRPRPVQP